MRRAIFSLVGALAVSAAMVGTVFAADCVNVSKQPDAGQHAAVMIDVHSGALTILWGANAAGHLTGGFVDVYLDLDGNGTPDVLAIDDTFLIANHSSNPNPAQGTPAVNPALRNGNDPGGPDHGVTESN